MRLRIPLWAALVMCAGSVALGSVWAQGQGEEKKPEDPGFLSEYPYLPNRYGEPYIPSVADWQAMRLTALGASSTRLTEHFSRKHLTCFPTPRGLVLTLDLEPQPGWKHYAGGGKFSSPAARVKPDLEQAVKMVLPFLRSFFPEVADKDVTLQVYLNSERVGAWQKGELTLAASPPQAK
jgi:hypothetical protein